MSKTEYLINLHIQYFSKLPSNKYQCCLCGKVFTNGLHQHLLEYHPHLQQRQRKKIVKELLFYCKHCKASFPDENLKEDHIKNTHKILKYEMKIQETCKIDLVLISRVGNFTTVLKRKR